MRLTEYGRKATGEICYAPGCNKPPTHWLDPANRMVTQDNRGWCDQHWREKMEGRDDG